MQILEEFHLKVLIPIKFLGIDISITNLVVWMFIGTFGFLTLLILLSWKPKMRPAGKQNIAEMLVEFISDNLVGSTLGKEGRRWLPFIGAIFIFILANNLVGLIPHSYTPTSNPVVPATMAIMVFVVVQITNMVKNGPVGYLRTFAPPGVPIWMWVIVVPIELVSNLLAKPFSLMIRLMANMLAGHIVILVLISMILFFKSYILAIPILPFTVIIYGFEIFVAALQAYIFAILSAIYIAEVVHPRH